MVATAAVVATTAGQRKAAAFLGHVTLSHSYMATMLCKVASSGSSRQGCVPTSMAQWCVDDCMVQCMLQRNFRAAVGFGRACCPSVLLAEV